VLNPRRGPPRLAPTVRDDQANFGFPLSRVDPRFTDVVCVAGSLFLVADALRWLGARGLVDAV